MRRSDKRTVEKRHLSNERLYAHCLATSRRVHASDRSASNAARKSALVNSGQVIPGYGHAVLRKTDPRFIAQLEFGMKHFPQDDVFRLAALVFEVVPPILVEQGKAKDPWPNVDAISGALQYHFGVREFDFYTVMFGISRLLGVTANLVWARALGQPIERPKSVTTKMLEDMAAKAKS